MLEYRPDKEQAESPSRRASFEGIPPGFRAARSPSAAAEGGHQLFEMMELQHEPRSRTDSARSAAPSDGARSRNPSGQRHLSVGGRARRPRSPTPCLDAWLLCLGRALLLLSLANALCRPDVSAALALLVLLGLRE